MKILGTGSALPKMTLTNDMLTQYFDTSDAWISSRTGIKQRQVMSDEHLEDLAAEASRHALENAGLTATDLDFIIEDLKTAMVAIRISKSRRILR